MKRILATVFMAVIAAAAFATVDVQTTSPAVYRGECSQIGSMKFIVSNVDDYQNLGTGNSVLLKIYLKGQQSLVPALIANVSTVDETTVDWVEVSIDNDDPNPGTAFFGTRPEVYYECGRDHFYVWFPEGSVQGTVTLPDANDQAYFSIDDSGLRQNPIFVTTEGLTINENVVTAISDFLLTDGQPMDPYVLDDAQTWEQRASNVADTTVTFLSTSYQPSDPSVAIVRQDQQPDLEVYLDCGYDKDENPVYWEPDIYLCKTDQAIPQGNVCYDGYRYGEICDIVIEGDYWQDNSFVRLTPSDPDNVWLADDFPMVTAPGMAVGEMCWEGQFEDSGNWGTNISSASEVVCDYGNQIDQNLVVAGDSFSSHFFARTLVIPVVTGAGTGTMTVYGMVIARWSDDTPQATVGVDMNYSMRPCDYTCTGFFEDYPYLCCECIADYGTLTLADVANFIACDDLLTTLEPQTIVLYYTYLPAVNGKWWAGAALINTTPLHMWTMYPVTAQDVHATLYFFEADGDLYMHDAGYIVAGGIWAASFTEGMAAVTPVTVQAGETTFGDERFWIVAEVEGTVPGTYITADGFGMLGDDVQAQGYLARLHVYGLLNMMTGMPDLSGTFNK